MIEIGETDQVSSVVTEKDTAHALLQDFEGTLANETYADVFATTKMIGLMELAAARMLQRVQTPEQLSVGVGVDVTHLNATPVGENVTATAKYLGRDGVLYKFEVEAFDTGGKIGEGTHERAIINVARFATKLAAKRAG